MRPPQPRGWGRGRRSARLATRLLIAGAAAGILIAGAFAVVVLAVAGLRDAARTESSAKDVTVATLEVQKLVLDVETGQRGYLLTDNRRFLGTWRDARRELPGRVARWRALAAHDPRQRRRAAAIATAIDDYVNGYSVPVVLGVAAPTPEARRSPLVLAEGKRQLDGLRARFDTFLAAEDRIARERRESADRQWRRAAGLAVGGLLASAGIIALFGVYLTRSIARPVRTTAAAAARVADGDLTVRLPGGGPGEVGELTDAFNTMAARLEQGHHELEAQNRRLRESEQLKSELVSIVSHEVRTPLASVLGFTALLLQRELDEPARRRYLEIVDAQARRLASLLDDFLDVQRVEEGRLEVARDTVDVREMLREQVQLFEAQSDRHRLELDVPPRPLLVQGDAGRLRQVVANLLSNAIKYSPGGGVVEVAADRDDGRVRLRVRDEGIGIPAEQQQRIFTKFFRGDAAASGITGTGLGLAVSRAIVEAHGGTIDFTSATGEGSEFVVELPAREAA